jgi:hypothetical protein
LLGLSQAKAIAGNKMISMESVVFMGVIVV